MEKLQKGGKVSKPEKDKILDMNAVRFNQRGFQMANDATINLAYQKGILNPEKVHKPVLQKAIHIHREVYRKAHPNLDKSGEIDRWLRDHGVQHE